MEPSKQQQVILDEILTGTSSIVVEARAGSGKTTTLVMIAEQLPKEKLCLFLAFNKNIATELQSRLPAHVQAKTFHSHCFGALQRNLPKRPTVDENKIFNICKDMLSRKDFERYYKFISRLVGYAKNSGVGCFDDQRVEDAQTWFALIDHYNLILDSDGNDEDAVHLAMDVLDASNSDVGVIDFDDMLYLALLRNVTFDKNNFVMLDEAQDTNRVQRELLKRMLALPQRPKWYTKEKAQIDINAMTNPPRWEGGGRLIAPGDPAQSIYGFRGADADALDSLTKKFNCKTFPLSVSYRCAKTVVIEAQKIVPEIESHPSAPNGSVERLQSYETETFSPVDAILCRVTAPLVTLAFDFIRRNTGVRILGREIGTNLVTLVKKMNTQNLDDLSEKLRRWSDREINKALARGHENAAAAIQDKVDCLNVFIDQLNEDERTTGQLIRRIEELFTDNNQGLLTLCSVHKAKGLEWEKVFILDRDTYMPSKWAKQEWQQRQEQNLIYVAITRAKLDLRYIKSGGWKQPKEASPTDEQMRLGLLETL